MADSPCMKNRSLKAGGRLNRWSFKAGFTVTQKNKTYIILKQISEKDCACSLSVLFSMPEFYSCFCFSIRFDLPRFSHFPLLWTDLFSVFFFFLFPCLTLPAPNSTSFGQTCLQAWWTVPSMTALRLSWQQHQVWLRRFAAVEVKFSFLFDLPQTLGHENFCDCSELSSVFFICGKGKNCSKICMKIAYTTRGPLTAKPGVTSLSFHHRHGRSWRDGWKKDEKGFKKKKKKKKKLVHCAMQRLPNFNTPSSG